MESGWYSLRLVLRGASLLLCPALALAGDGPPLDWRALAATRKLSATQIARLEHDGFVTVESLPRGFEALKHEREPAFLSTDIALEAFHALLSDSMEALAATRREPLGAYLAALWKMTNADAVGPLGSDPLGQSALKHVRRTIGPALLLLGQPLEGIADSERIAIEAEVQRIRAGQPAEPPLWLAPPSEDPSLAAQERIDYAAMQPVGFYAQTPELADLFRATRWLQAVPFRARLENEAVAALLLGSRKGGQPTPPALVTWFELMAPYRSPAVEKIGLWQGDPTTATEWSSTARKILAGRKPFEVDPRRRRLGDAGDPLSRVVFHVLPSGLSADQDALNEAVVGTQRQGALPTGLIVAGWLGFAEAEQQARNAGWSVPPRPWEAAPAPRAADDNVDWDMMREGYLRSEILSQRAPSIAAVLHDNPHEHLLALWRSLTQPPAPWAPEFMRRPAWQWKSANTALASWALTRRAFALEQPDALAVEFGIDAPPPLIVEPSPEFWSAFRAVVEVFDRQFASASPPGAHTNDDLESAIATANNGDWTALRRFYLNDRWAGLLKASRSIERLCLRQGTNLPADAEDTQLAAFLYDILFFATTGEGGGSFGSNGAIPPDRAPQTVPVWNIPSTNATLHVAVGRPRRMLVLYPWQGQQVLCRSAVLTYHEFTEPDGKRVTDAEWKARLDSANPPRPPEWLQPLFGP